MTRWTKAVAIGSIALVTTAALSPLAAQAPPHQWEPTETFGDVAYLGLNTLVGALTAGVANRIQGRPFKDALVVGGLGGALGFGAKRLAAQQFDGAGFLGREMGAVGASMVRNASEGNGAFEELMLPLGPLRFYVRPAERRLAAVRVFAPEAMVLMWAATQSELDVLWGESLSAGTFTFEATNRRILSDGEPVSGVNSSGVIYVEGVLGEPRAFVLAHERVHSVQLDFISHAWAGPLDRGAIKRVGRFERVWRWVDPGLFLVPAAYLTRLSGWREAEARYFEIR